MTKQQLEFFAANFRDTDVCGLLNAIANNDDTLIVKHGKALETRLQSRKAFLHTYAITYARSIFRALANDEPTHEEITKVCDFMRYTKL